MWCTGRTWGPGCHHSQRFPKKPTSQRCHLAAMRVLYCASHPIKPIEKGEARSTSPPFATEAGGMVENTLRGHLGDGTTLQIAHEQLLSSSVYCPYIFLMLQGKGWNGGWEVLPEGKCSLMAQLSTWSVALPPFLVKRTTWYLPSFTAILLSCTMMSTVPMLNMTPILPCSWKHNKDEHSFSFVNKI